MARKKRANPEDQLHEDVVAQARLQLRRGVFFFHVPNQNSGTIGWRMKLKRMGARAGTPDLVFVYQGRAHFMELKAPKGTTSDVQHEAHADIRNAGAPVAICKSIPEVVSAWNRWGLTNAPGNHEDAARRVA